MVVTKQQKQEIRANLAETLHEQLGQHLAGTVLAAGALSAHLARRHAPEAREAAYLLEMLKKANEEVNRLIVILDEGKLLAFDTPTALRARTLSSSLEEAFARITGRRLYSATEPTPE